MNEKLKDRIFAMCAVPSVSGFEPRMSADIAKMIGDAFDENYTDAVGNQVFIKRCERENAPTLLIDTHFDEIGMIVTDICDGGFLKLTSMGGLSPSVLQAADVVVYGKQILRGVITSTPPHLRGGADDSLPNIEELLVDVGYTKDELSSLVPIGTPVGFAPCYATLACGALSGKSFDNKACAAIAAYAISKAPREALSANVALLLSSYEETSRIGGASVGAFAVQPDYAMVIDVNLARVPDTPKSETVPLRGGVSLSVCAATDMRLTEMTRVLCEEKGIDHTMIASPASTGTNATSVNLVGGGIPVVDIGLPLRNMHTYNEVIAPEDIDALYRLVREFICSDNIAEVFGEYSKEELPI